MTPACSLSSSAPRKCRCGTSTWSRGHWRCPVAPAGLCSSPRPPPSAWYRRGELGELVPWCGSWRRTHRLWQLWPALAPLVCDLKRFKSNFKISKRFFMMRERNEMSKMDYKNFDSSLLSPHWFICLKHTTQGIMVWLYRMGGIYWVSKQITSI